MSMTFSFLDSSRVWGVLSTSDVAVIPRASNLGTEGDDLSTLAATGPQNERIVFQPPFFRGKLAVKLRGCKVLKYQEVKK